MNIPVAIAMFYAGINAPIAPFPTHGLAAGEAKGLAEPLVLTPRPKGRKLPALENDDG
jgi:hypothetical protein